MSRTNGGYGGDLLFLMSIASLAACSSGDAESGVPVTNNTGWPDAPSTDSEGDEDEDEDSDDDDDDDRDGGTTSGGGPTGPDDTPWPDSDGGEPPQMPPASTTTTGADPTDGSAGTSGDMPPDSGSDAGDDGSTSGDSGDSGGVDVNAICQAYGMRYAECYGYGDPSAPMQGTSYCIMDAMSYGGAAPGCGQAFEEMYACLLSSPCGQVNCDAQVQAFYGNCGG